MLKFSNYSHKSCDSVDYKSAYRFTGREYMYLPE